MTPQENEEAAKPPPDIWRDSLLRYAGYANEVGEAFRNVAPRAVMPSYAVAFAYVAGDTADKANQAASRGYSSSVVAWAAADVFLWQSLASVAIPGVCINRVVKWTTTLTQRPEAVARVPAPVRAWAPTAIGLSTIPFIVHPIDTAVDVLFDATIRAWANNNGLVPAPPSSSGSSTATHQTLDPVQDGRQERHQK